jgi:hypothetical protein
MEEDVSGSFNSPARYAKTLSVGCPQVVTAADAEAGGWIRGFSASCTWTWAVRGWAFPTILSRPIPRILTRHQIPPRDFRHPYVPQIFDLILSFPLLEDLSVTVIYSSSIDNGDDSDWLPTTAQPSSPPMFTGSLELYLKGGMESFTRRLLSLPGGIHFRKLTLTWVWGRSFVDNGVGGGCSHTLESLDITELYGTSIRHLCPHR